MSTYSEIKIDPQQTFEHLPRAPIVEAVIEIRARATQTLEESAVRSHLEPRMDGYGFLDSRRQFRGEVKLETGKPSSQAVRDMGWKGLRFRSSDEKHIAQFNRDGFVFSRLEPYVNWDQLSGEGLRLWRIFKELAQPVEINRIGLRFINRIKLPPGERRFEDYIQSAPASPCGLDLPFHGFMHHDRLAVPGNPYAINVNRTIQPPAPTGGSEISVILDIDVITTQEFELDDTLIARHLLKMRWLKNKAFFGSILEKALETFR